MLEYVSFPFHFAFDCSLFHLVEHEVPIILWKLLLLYVEFGRQEVKLVILRTVKKQDFFFSFRVPFKLNFKFAIAVEEWLIKAIRQCEIRPLFDNFASQQKYRDLHSEILLEYQRSQNSVYYGLVSGPLVRLCINLQ